MAYHIELHEATVVPYLASLDFSPEGPDALIRILDELGEYGDTFLRDHERRLAPDSDKFEVRWVFRDPTTRMIHTLRFIVSDTAAQFGVLRILYADELTTGRDHSVT